MKKLCPTQRAARHRVRRAPVLTKTAEVYPSPGFTANGPFPAGCADFNQLGMRVPLIAVSPFSKPHYVSHTTGDHTSLLALIEKRFFGDDAHLTARDANASTLEDLFDFDHSPSLDAAVSPELAPAPAAPCAP